VRIRAKRNAQLMHRVRIKSGPLEHR